MTRILEIRHQIWWNLLLSWKRSLQLQAKLSSFKAPVHVDNALPWAHNPVRDFHKPPRFHLLEMVPVRFLEDGQPCAGLIERRKI